MFPDLTLGGRGVASFPDLLYRYILKVICTGVGLESGVETRQGSDCYMKAAVQLCKSIEGVASPLLFLHVHTHTHTHTPHILNPHTLTHLVLPHTHTLTHTYLMLPHTHVLTPYAPSHPHTLTPYAPHTHTLSHTPYAPSHPTHSHTRLMLPHTPHTLTHALCSLTPAHSHTLCSLTPSHILTPYTLSHSHTLTSSQTSFYCSSPMALLLQWTDSMNHHLTLSQLSCSETWRLETLLPFQYTESERLMNLSDRYSSTNCLWYATMCHVPRISFELITMTVEPCSTGSSV